MTVALNFLLGKSSPVSSGLPGAIGGRFLTTIGDLTLDCLLTETHQGRVEVTDHPVEDGYDVTDHARPKPVQLAIEGIVTNTPFNITSGAQRTVTNRGVSFPSNTDADRNPNDVSYADDALAYLWDLHDNPRTVTIETLMKTYDNMLMVSFNAPRKASTGDAIQFTSEWKEIRIVTVKKVTKQVRLAKKAAKGKVQAAPATAPPIDGSKLKSLTDRGKLTSAGSGL